MKGLLHIYTGDGKGKTTAAAGLAARAAGQGLEVGFFQFLKNGVSGEVISLTQLGVDVFSPQCGGFYHEMTTDEQKRCREQQQKMLQRAAERAGEYDLLVLDEVICALELGVVEREDVERLVEERPDGLELVLTGRGADEALIALGDYVTEMQPLHHPYDGGQLARRGIEY